ncbi:hypothetical protein GLT92_00770 [Nanohaloarchaea archaeon]|nr:hypothetical protein [Candidatus Nanohaloarchaea archaeon]
MIAGIGASLEWSNPDPDTQQNLISEGFELNVTDPDHPDESVIFYWSVQGEDEKNRFAEDTQSSSVGDINYWTAELSDQGSGEYTILANLTNGSDTISTESIDLTKDQGSPSISLQNRESGFVQDNPDVSVVVEDDFSDIDSMTVSTAFTDILGQQQENCSSGNKCIKQFSLDTGQLSDGQSIDLSAEASDIAGNLDSETFPLTYDGSYEADQPEFSIPDADDNDDVHVTGDVEVDVTVDNIDEETSNVRVTCFVDGEELDQTDFEDENDFSCDLPEDDLEDGDSEVSVEACDQAGNCENSDERSFTFDSTPPILDSFSTVQDYKKFGGSFEAEFSAEDPDSGIQKAEYFFSTAVLPGEGNDVDQVDDERFTVEESEITTDDVDQTVYLRVMNDVGQWSDRKSVEFDYYPDEAPEVSLDVPENVTVVAGEQKSFDVVVENTGTLLVDSVNVKVSSDVFEGTEELSDISGSETATFDLSPNQSQIGRYEVTVETDGPVDSASFDLSVEANEEQRQQIESRLSDLSSEAEKVRSNISGLRSDGIDSDLNRTIEEDVDPFVQKVERAQNLTQQGNYYLAQNVLESVEQLERSAEDNLKQVRKKERVRERNRLIKMVLSVLAVLVAAAIGLLVYARREDMGESDLSIGKFNVPDMSNTRDKFYDLIDGIKQKVEELEDEIDQKEEEAEKKFEGFK